MAWEDAIKLLQDFFGQGGWVLVLIAVVSVLSWRQGLSSWGQANGIMKDLARARKFFEVGDGLGAVSGLAGEAELSDGGEVKTLLAATKKVDRIKPSDCRTYAEKQFSREKMTRDYVEVYKRILSGKK